MMINSISNNKSKAFKSSNCGAFGEINRLGKKNTTIKVTIFRLNIILLILICFFLTITFRLLDLTFTNLEEVPNIVLGDSSNNFQLSRGNILDRNNNLIATNIPTASLYAHPKQVINYKKVAKEIAKALKEVDEFQLFEKLNSNKQFIWIKRHLTPDEQQKIYNLGLPGLYFMKDEKRFYPHNNLFSHILGYVDIDGNGIAGIEKSYDNQLKKQDIELSIDIRVQHILHDELTKAIAVHNATGAMGIVIAANTGEVVGMTSLPDYNPNTVNKFQDKESMFNQVTLGVREMGSVLKTLTIAVGIDSGKIKVNDIFDVSRPIKIGRFTIHDYKGKGGNLSIPEILMYSSNLGVAQVAQRLGIFHQKEYLRKVGFLAPIKFDLPEIGKPIYPSDKRWSEANLITISYGHGIAVTALHIAQVMSMIVNGGILYQPTLLKINEKIIGRRVLQEKTSLIMRKLLRLVVEKGSGKFANIDKYMVGGKTGTAEILVNGKYNKNLNMCLFVGAFPINKPEYIVFIALDEPKPNKVNKGNTTGGFVAAPIAGQIIEKIGEALDLKYQDIHDIELEKQMFVDYKPQYKLIANR